jgi:cytochrome b pre-mRNA-processing protein 3
MVAALAPEPYAAGIVPDDLDHRVQMVALHAAVLVWQLALRPEKALRRLPQRIHTRVFDGFDASFRETGVGDASIARKVRKLGEHYYGLGAATAACLSGAEDQRQAELTDLLRRNAVTAAGYEPDLAGYLVAVADALQAAPSEVFLAGSFSWPGFPVTSRPGVAKV